MGMDDRVHFTGWHADIPGAMSDLDVAVLTSRNEGTPVALIEAAATGRAVVATDVGGVRSVVQDGVTGLLAPAGDAERASTLIGPPSGQPGAPAADGRGRAHARAEPVRKRRPIAKYPRSVR